MDSTTADTFRQKERIPYALFMNVNTRSTDFNFLCYCVIVCIYWRHDLAPASNYCAWVLLYTYWHGLQLSDSYSPFERGRVWLCFALLMPWQSNSNSYHVRYTWATWSPCFIPLFDLLALFDPPDLHVGASKICLPSGRPVCVCTLLLTCRNFFPV